MLQYPHISPVIYDFGRFQIRWYGVMYAIGFTLAWLLGRYRAKKPNSGWTTIQVDDFITYAVIGLVVGARIGYVLFYNFEMFLKDPWMMFRIWQGGMSFHGGLLGVCLAVWYFARKYNKPYMTVGDFVVPLAPLGLFAGRMGNFINGELWGRVTTAPWGMVFPGPEAGIKPRHPSQLYEAGLEGLLLFAILWIYSAKPRPTGRVMGLFLMCYGLFRFTVEFFRQPDSQLGFIALNWLTMGQILCIPMILIGGYLFVRRVAE